MSIEELEAEIKNGVTNGVLQSNIGSQQLELVRRAICIVRIRTTKVNALRRARGAMPTPLTSPHDTSASRATQILTNPQSGDCAIARPHSVTPIL